MSGREKRKEKKRIGHAEIGAEMGGESHGNRQRRRGVVKLEYGFGHLLNLRPRRLSRLPLR